MSDAVHNIKISERSITFVENFIAKYYKKQPPWIRSLTFLVFLVLFTHAFITIIGGEHAVRGRLVRSVEGDVELARNHEIRIGDRFFATNSKGLFYLVLGPIEYYEMVFKGSIRLDINHNEEIFPSVNAHYRRVARELDDVSVPTSGAETRLSRENSSHPSPLTIASIAWARQLSPGDRLFVIRVDLTTRSRVKEAQAQLVWGKSSMSLRFVHQMGEGRTTLPLISGRALRLAYDYYFDLGTGEPSGNAQIYLSGGAFSFYRESFKLELARPYGEPFEARSEAGNTLRVVRMTPFDVVIWDKADIAAAKNRIKSEFTAAGFRVVEKTYSPLGYGAQTNALFGGSAVTFSALQKVLRVVYEHGMQLKTIQYKLALRSGNKFEIQLGGSRYYDDAPVIETERLHQLMNATTEAEFERALASL